MAYEFIIRNETEDGESSAVAGQSGETGGETAKSSAGKSSKESLTAGQLATAKGLVAWKKASPWVNQVVSHEIGLVELRTGSRIQQQKAEFAMQVASEAIGFGESVLTGYAIGNVPGAIIGGVMSLGHTLLSISQKAQTINEQRSLENRSIQLNYIRAGALGSRAKYE